MVRRVGGLAGEGFREQMIDALVFSLAVYETAPDKILSVLKYKYDLPVGALDLLHIEGLFSQGLPAYTSSAPGTAAQPIIVGRSTHGHVVVACRGTADLSDLIQDLKIIPKWLQGASGGVAAHMGFVERAESVDLQPFLSLLSRGEKLVFTGHSLGGAVSSLLALRVLEAAEKHGLCTHLGQVQCITFGAPLFASPTLANCINEKYHDYYCHVVGKHDLIPRIVPLVRMAQRLVGCGPHELVEGLRFLRIGLQFVENVTRLPVATAFRAAEALIPGPVKALVCGAIKLFWPSSCKTPQQYAFAGKFLFVDPRAQKEEHAVRITHGHELNAVQSELIFALGLNMNVLAHHGLHAYQQGVVRGLRSRLLAHFHRRRMAAPGAEEGKGRRRRSFEREPEERVVALAKSLTPEKPRRPERATEGQQEMAGGHLLSSMPRLMRKRSSGRFSMDHLGSRPGMAAAAMEAASAGLRARKLMKLRKDMERGFAAASFLSSNHVQHGAEANSLASREPWGCSAAREYADAAGVAIDWPAKGVPVEGFPESKECLCCRLLKQAERQEQDGGAGAVPDSPKAVVPAAAPKRNKGRFRAGWIFQGILRATQLARSLNFFTVAFCAVRFLIGSPLF